MYRLPGSHNTLLWKVPLSSHLQSFAQVPALGSGGARMGSQTALPRPGPSFVILMLPQCFPVHKTPFGPLPCLCRGGSSCSHFTDEGAGLKGLLKVAYTQWSSGGWSRAAGGRSAASSLWGRLSPPRSAPEVRRLYLDPHQELLRECPRAMNLALHTHCGFRRKLGINWWEKALNSKQNWR